jgi:hypothetical protein
MRAYTKEQQATAASNAERIEKIKDQIAKLEKAARDAYQNKVIKTRERNAILEDLVQATRAVQELKLVFAEANVDLARLRLQRGRQGK